MSAALAVDTGNVRVQTLRHAHPDPDHARCGSRPGWAVCQTHPQAERWARDHLTRQGYDAYLPLCTVTRRDPVLRTLTRQVEVPLFASYLFVAIRSPHWSPICHTLGVRRLLMSDGKPHIVAEAAVSALQAGEDARRSVLTPGASWAPGTPCRPATGAFAGHEGVVLAVHRQTATVALLLFGHLRKVQMPLTALAPRD